MKEIKWENFQKLQVKIQDLSRDLKTSVIHHRGQTFYDYKQRDDDSRVTSAATEIVPQQEKLSGFYSTYFLVP